MDALTAPRIVLVAFGDHTLGGVSRSALSAGQVWRSMGYTVHFLAFLPVHRERQEGFQQVGRILHRLEDVEWSQVALVDLHHSALAPQTLEHITSVIEAAPAAGRCPPMLTKNVFAVRDRVLDDWRGPRATGVPASWAAYQYRYNCWPAGARYRPWIVPNVQDDSTFRLPTAAERAQARRRLGLEDQHCVLRVGSPLPDKWSSSYIPLADAVESRGGRLVVVGAPPSLAARLATSAAVTVVPVTADDRQLRSLYWAADSFALDSRRGETFGNVAFEALLCGLRVAYRARPSRDNSLWELRGLHGFAYCRTEAEWISAVVATGAVEPSDVAADREHLVARYSAGPVGEVLKAALTALSARREPVHVSAAGKHAAVPLGLGDRSRVWIRHNPAASKVKERRLSSR